MDKTRLKNVVADQRELVAAKFDRERLVVREGLDKCGAALRHPNVLLISGLRRAGKSVFAHMLAKKASYAALNFDDERLIDFSTRDFNPLMECFYEFYDNFEFVLFDEIQNVKGWELFINRLREKCKVIVTGSNANLMSREMATHLTGRYSDHVLFPMDFREYLDFKQHEFLKADIHSTRKRTALEKLFRSYLYDGGIFEHHKFGKEFIRNLFNSIVTRDVVARYGVKYPHELEELAVLLVNYATSKLSVSKLAAHLKIKSSHTVKEYIGYLEASFLFFSIRKFSYKIKEQFSAFKKIYCMDNGIISSMIFNFSENRGRFLENLVAIELLRDLFLTGHETFYWDDYNVECDFVVKKGAKVVEAYQVCAELNDQNRKREIGGLVGAMKSFRLKRGTILTLSDEDEAVENGFKIKVVPVWRWLLQKELIRGTL